MKLSSSSNNNSIEELSPVVANSSAKEQNTNVLSQATPPMISTDIPSPRSEEEILEALKESSILVPKRVHQERCNKELFLRIAELGRVILKTKLMRIFKLSSAVEAVEEHTQGSPYIALSESLCANPVELQVNESSIISKITPEAPTSEVCSTHRNQEDATTANDNTKSEATRRHTEELTPVTSSEVQQDIIAEAVTPSVSRTRKEAIGSDVTEELEEQDASVTEDSCDEATERDSKELSYSTINGATMQTIAALIGASSFDISNMENPTPPEKIILTYKINISAPETEKRKITRKWNYIKVIISDIKDVLKEKQTSVEIAEIIEDSLEELQQFGQDIDASMEELVSVLKKLVAEIKHQSSLDKQIVKSEISSRLSTELTALTDSNAQYEQTAYNWKNTLDMQENILEKVIKRRGGYDTKILEQQNKIAKIKEELATAERELESMEKRRKDLVEEEEKCKEERKSTILELDNTEEKLNAITEKISQINDYLVHLDETIDRQFELQEKEMLDMVKQLLELEIS
ncbi:uncharacterized protein [Typha latifolia]|uniref:uncharacterized protein isoform X1 n=1 Tax=Typha latifolia TaxID=4733 RepID=UPI003C2D72F1